jgi:HPt (histidine-containing phosphotransfer) domain-containing protein
MAESAIDLAAFRELQDMAGADFVDELATTFVNEVPVMMAELERALAAGDAVAFRRAAHSLKSNANTFGARSLGEMARALELQGPPAAADARALPALAAEFARVAAALESLRHG